MTAKENSTGPQEAGSGTQQGGRQQQVEQQQKRLEGRMALVDNTVAVLSGKGGVGKSTMAVHLAAALQDAGNRVALLDADMHGPSTPRMLNLEDAKLYSDGQTLSPAEHPSGLKVMSIGFMLQQRDEAVVWRGPLKMNVLRQFLADVEWGELDYLIVDLPPGTGDEPLSICQLIPEMTGGVVVTTPQEVALNDVRKCVNFCRQIELPVLGVIENMSGFVCPHCGERSDIFGTGGGEEMSEEMDVPFLGRVPLDPRMVQAADEGRLMMETLEGSPAGEALEEIVDRVLEATGPDGE
jgi:Mrp family chromosome partitioning ATPase